jgi:hypothetical protein
MLPQGYTDLKSRLTANNDLSGILKEAVVAWGTTTVLSEETEENQEISARIADDPTQTRSEHLRDTIQYRYRYSNKQKKLRGFSPPANYTGRATAACRRS